MSGEKLRSRDDGIRDDRRQLGGSILKERRESIEVGEGIIRPLDIYWADHGRN